jgi:hypothetical protein
MKTVMNISAKIMVIVGMVAVMAANTQTATAQSMRGLQASLAKVLDFPKEIAHHEEVNMEARAVPLSPAINSAYEELKPELSPCGKRLYFSRHFHPGNTNGTEDAEDIWFTEFDDQTNTWSAPERLEGGLNNAGPNYINNVSVTGDTLILGNTYGKNGKMKAGVSYSVNIHGSWTAPKTIAIENDYNISNHSNTHVDLSRGVIIRAVQRCETVGNRDLYVSFWDGKKATEPISMGNVLNTTEEESSPYLASDNKTLYFASKGHNGHGGYDIFVSERLDDTWTNWSEPKNLGPAVNGKLDDEFFTITHCGEFAIFSKKVSVHNVDLFRIPMKELFKNTEPSEINEENEVEGIVAVASL